MDPIFYFLLNNLKLNLSFKFCRYDEQRSGYDLQTFMNKTLMNTTIKIYRRKSSTSVTTLGPPLSKVKNLRTQNINRDFQHYPRLRLVYPVTLRTTGFSERSNFLPRRLCSLDQLKGLRRCKNSSSPNENQYKRLFSSEEFYRVCHYFFFFLSYEKRKRPFISSHVKNTKGFFISLFRIFSL